MARSLFDSLISGARDLANTATRGDLPSKAKDTWNAQSTLTKGAIAGGLLGVLLSGSARRIVGTGVQVGGAALIGGLAYKAYQDWQNGGATSDPAAAGDGADDMPLRLFQAMIAATKADGQVTPDERARIEGHIAQFGPEASSLLAEELDAPFDPNRVAALARSPQEAAQIYAASLLAVDPEAPAEKGYLALLAARLNLDAGLVAHLHTNAESLN